MTTQNGLHHVVVVGGGFGGLYTVTALKNAPVKITLIDQQNFHLFQPLLYQVATGGLSPADIASPLRAVLKRQPNVVVMKAKVTDLDPEKQVVIFNDGEIAYDSLVIATGVTTSYFGNDEWSNSAPGLKSMDDAMEIRRRIFLSFEAAERETNEALRQAWMTFVIVGGGPTGVEMTGAITELANTTLKDDFRDIDPREARVILLEGLPRILPPYPPELSRKATDSLIDKGATVITNAMVTGIEGDTLTVSIKVDEEEKAEEQIQAKTIVWAAGMQATGVGKVLADKAGAETDRTGRIIVEPDFSVAGHPNIFVIGDLAHYAHTEDGEPLPGVAPVAMQQGRHLAKQLHNNVLGKSTAAFSYTDKGSLAVIGRNAAVARVGSAKFSGFFAWIIWIFVHIAYLVEYDNRVLVLFQWAINYFTRKRGARLIIGPDPYPLVEKEHAEQPHISHNSNVKAQTQRLEQYAK